MSTERCISSTLEVNQLTTIFVRHGESIWNQRGLAQGQSDAPGLTAKGREQSERVATSLVGRGATLVVASDLSRAQETALIISGRLKVPVLSDPRLRERNMGLAEGQPVCESASRTLGIVEGVVSDADRVPMGGETLREFAQRVAGLLGDLWRSHAPGTIVVVTHGGFLRMARRAADGGELVGMSWADVDNGALWTGSWPPSGSAGR